MFAELLVNEEDYCFQRRSRMYSDLEDNVAIWKEVKPKTLLNEKQEYWTWNWSQNCFHYSIITEFEKLYLYKDYDYVPVYIDKGLKEHKASTLQEVLDIVKFVYDHVCPGISDTLTFKPTTAYIPIPHSAYADITFPILGQIIGISKRWSPSIYIVDNHVYKTRKAYLDTLRNIVSEQLDEYYNLKNYQNFINATVLELPPGYNYQTIRPAWWALFVKPEIDLTEIF